MPVFDMPNGLIERIVNAAPEFALSKSALGQTVSWSENGPVSLGAYISARIPQLAHKLSLGPHPDAYAPSADRLSDENLQKVVYTRLMEGADADTRLAVLGQGTYSIADLKQQIEKKTELGLRLLAAERRNIRLLERLAEAGKISGEANEPAINVPPFDF